MFTVEQLRNNSAENREAYLELAKQEFDERVDHMVKVKEYLDGKPFKLGQVVMCRQSKWFSKIERYMDVWKMGIVIRHGIPDGDGDYYRIHFNEKDDFSAIDECDIRVLQEDEEIQPHLKEYVVKWNLCLRPGKLLTIKTFK